MKSIIVLFFLASCSSLKFATNTGIPMSWGTKPGHNHFVRLGGVVPLYLWGIIEPPEAISLNREFANYGALSVSKLTVAEDGGFDVWWPRLITFGMYWPVKWRAEGFIQQASKEME